MKRIAIVTPYGAEPRLDNYAEFILAQNLVEKGYEVRFFTYRSQKAEYVKDAVYKGVSVFRCRQRFGISPRLFVSLILFRPHTVLCFHPKSLLNFSAYLAARAIRTRFIVEIVGILHDPFIARDIDDPIDTLISPPVLITSVPALLKQLRSGNRSAWNNYVCHAPTAHADTIIAITRHEQEYVKSIYGRSAALIYWCTPQTRVHDQHEPAIESGKLPDDFLFFIGQVKRRKGWDTVIDALASLKQRGVIKNLVFVSPHTDLHVPIEYAAERGVRDQITFLSAVSNEEKEWLYAHCSYVLVPSRYEGFGLPVFEAFLAEKPICASDIPVFDEFLVHRKNAMISHVGDGNGLADSILALDASSALVHTLIKEGTRTAAQFDYERMVSEYLALIDGDVDSLLSSPAQGRLGRVQSDQK